MFILYYLYCLFLSNKQYSKVTYILLTYEDKLHISRVINYSHTHYVIICNITTCIRYKHNTYIICIFTIIILLQRILTIVFVLMSDKNK